LRLHAAVQLLLRKVGDISAGYRVKVFVRDIKRLDVLQNLGLGPADLFVAFLDIPVDGIAQGRCLLAFRLSFERIKGTGSRRTFLAVFDPNGSGRSALECLTFSK